MQMDNLELSKKVCGLAASTYLANKHRGGKAGGEGVQYENWFAVYNAAKLVRDTIQNGLPAPYLSTQTMDFVDDFVILWNEDSCHQHFQLKNTENVSWSSGDHPIADDFRYQKLLNEGAGVGKTSSTLVLPCAEKAARLQRSIPEDISNYSAVEQFAFGETLNHLLQIEPKLRDALASLCVNADLDKIERLGSLFVGEWVSNCGTPCNLKDLWERVLRHEPNYVRSLSRVDILEKFEAILMQIEGFHYTMGQGFFEWSYLESDSGVLEYSVGSEKFSEFQRIIVMEEPSTFEELERHLI
ncbi:hypothetical protein [Marinobacter sp. S6332]|uniref:hypothetical protein n=1 Tax=Marinobacter sp. S6332 TaxID=2926403 RepID=UPI001FF4457B|nr:hypothetical protein [Marinobacter sp. S6332]MCK0162665.1 hypothetical protein [Marinobacter sp. S6332]